MSTSFGIEEVYQMKVQEGIKSHKNCSTMLHSEPSFSIFSTDQNQDSVDNQDHLEFDIGNKNMGLIEENYVEERGEERINRLSGLVKNLEIVPDKDEDLGEYYKRILKEQPSNSLFLRNYAQFLQWQGDLLGAEEYYNRATLADPQDGEILTQYAELVWELYRDQEKASSYFERAVSASPSDSNIQAAYARFLWEVEEREDEEEDYDDDSLANNKTMIGSHDSVGEDQQKRHSLNVPSSAETSSDEKGSVEDYYKRMIAGNPGDPLCLRNYAEFLYESKGDLAGAEEYYSHATLVYPSDGETLSQYAKLVWQLHHDKYKATVYFERAVQVSPENSDVLGGYARFLWEVEEDEE